MAIGWVDSLLCRWGAWAIANATGSLGYPKVSPTCRDYRPVAGEVYQPFDPGFIESDILMADRAIQSLPHVPRIVVVAHYQHSRSWAETARLTGVSRQAAKTYVSEAQNKIARTLDNIKTNTL